MSVDDKLGLDLFHTDEHNPHITVNEDYDNMDEVQKRTASVYCHELTRSCFPKLNIPLIEPSIWCGAIRSKKKQFLAQSFLMSPDLDLMYDSDFSEPKNPSK